MKKSEYILNTAKLMRSADQEQARRVFLIVSVMLAPESDTATPRMSAQDALRSDIQEIVEAIEDREFLEFIFQFVTRLKQNWGI